MKLFVSTFFFLTMLVAFASSSMVEEEVTPGTRGRAAELLVQRSLKKDKPVNVPNGKAVGWYCCKPLSKDSCDDWNDLATADCLSRIAGSDFKGCAKVNNKCEEIKP